MSIYSEMQAVFNELAADPDFEQGPLVYIEMVTATGGTPDDPGEPTPVSHPFKGFVRPVSTKYVDGTHIVATDKQLAVPGDLAVVPTMNGFISVDGVKHKIVQLDPIPASGTPVVYRAFVRR